jgi:predicted ATPase
MSRCTRAWPICEPPARIWQPTFLALIAEADGRTGRAERGLEVLDEAMTIVGRNEERFYEAELHRLRGELLMSTTANSSEAERCFRTALEIAGRQKARSLELRAATSIARLWAKAGRRSEGLELLAPVHGWFTEGFDTPDLKEAKALLDALPQ